MTRTYMVYHHLIPFNLAGVEASCFEVRQEHKWIETSNGEWSLLLLCSWNTSLQSLLKIVNLFNWIG